jgi:hypothetical protein
LMKMSKCSCFELKGLTQRLAPIFYLGLKDK